MRSIRAGSRVALCCVVVVALAAGAAHASRAIEFEPTERLVAATAGLRFVSPEAEFAMECEAQLRFSLHESILKAEGALAGFVNGLALRNCLNGTATVLEATLPWHITYHSFAGTLPNIRSLGLAINEFRVLISALGGLVRCLYRGSVHVTTLGNPITQFRAVEETALELSQALSAFCPGRIEVRGTLELEPVVAMTLVP